MEAKTHLMFSDENKDVGSVLEDCTHCVQTKENVNSMAEGLDRNRLVFVGKGEKTR
jgi:hypothetical protein